MPQNAQTDLRITDQFDLEVFWKKHGRKILIAVGAVVAFGAVLLFRQSQSNQRMEQAATRLAMANDPASLEQVAREFAGTQIALEALSRQGDLQYRAGRYAEAASTYENILRDYASNPLAESARLGLAAIQEAQGNFEAAKGLYWRIVESNPASFIAIAARMGTARCLEVLGQAREARQIYEEMLAGLQGSPWQQEAYLRWLILGRDLPAIPPSTTEPAQGVQPLNQPSFPLGGIPAKTKP